MKIIIKLLGYLSNKISIVNNKVNDLVVSLNYKYTDVKLLDIIIICWIWI